MVRNAKKLKIPTILLDKSCVCFSYPYPTLFLWVKCKDVYPIWIPH